MTNPLVEHLREGADAAGGGAVARARRLLAPAFWTRQRLRLRQRPVIRVCLGLVAAFFCGIALGVGIAAIIAPGPATYSVASVPGGADAAQTGPNENGEPVVAVSVRKETAAAARRRPLTLLDIDPISHAEAALPPARAPSHTPAPVSTSDAAERHGSPSVAPAPADTATRAAPTIAPAPAPAARDDAGSGHNLADEALGEAVSDHPAGPPHSGTGGGAKRVSPADVAGNATSAEAPAASTAVAANPGVSFEGARGVAEAARGDRVPHAQVALGPVLLRKTPAVAPNDETAAGPETAEALERPGNAGDVSPAPHPPAKNLQLAALPMLRSPAWIRNAVAVPDRPRDAMIAMIIDDMGIDQKRSRAVIGLPGPLTLSFIPYGYHLDELVASARGNGHEIMLHQPMEPMDSEADPGPNALRTTVSLEENRRRLLWSFTRLNGIVGVNNHMGSRFTAWQEGMEMVMKEVSARGLLFVDSITNNESIAYRVARDHKLPSAFRDVFIDHDVSREAIEKSLEALERVARRRGHAVGIAHPHDRTREALESWMLEARTRGFDFVPISHIVRQRMKSG